MHIFVNAHFSLIPRKHSLLMSSTLNAHFFFLVCQTFLLYILLAKNFSDNTVKEVHPLSAFFSKHFPHFKLSVNIKYKNCKIKRRKLENIFLLYILVYLTVCSYILTLFISYHYIIAFLQFTVFKHQLQ